MADPNFPEVNGERLKRRIRQEAERRRGKAEGNSIPVAAFASDLNLEELLKLLKGQRWEVAPLKPVSGTLTALDRVAPKDQFSPPERYPTDLKHISALDDVHFVQAAYLTILQRNVDESGLSCYRNMLREGATKLHIIGALLNSDEGKLRKAKATGIRLQLLLDSISRWPIFGRMVRMLAALWKLPDAALQNRKLRAELAYNWTETNREMMQLTDTLRSAIDTLECSQSTLAEQARLFASRTQTDLVQRATIAALDAIQKLDEELRNKSDTEELKRVHAAVENRINSDIVGLRSTLSDELNKLSGLLNRQRADQAETETGLHAAILRVDSDLLTLNQNFLDQELRIQSLCIQIEGGSPDHYLDSLYAELESEFRGTRGDIKNRQAIYLPYVREVDAGTDHAPVIDLGSGRGEWLELLRDHQFVAKGVDVNRVFVASCREMGLDLTESDILSYLRSLKSDSVGMITSFHVIEHMPLKSLIAFLDEAFRVLRQGGSLIVETPNPKNMKVAGYTFYLDPTHIHPIPYELARYLIEARGFSRVELLELHPAIGEIPIQAGAHAVTNALNGLLFSAQDYAIIGRKML